ncbi:MAG: SUF system Fe-S cluster assembly protein [Bacteroidetes bacterium]|nr:SUF system Fe-S cluster assembly protein [Bacteroidota bacterium]
MANIVANSELEQKIIEALKTVFDPEVPVNIYELGLIYEVNVDDQKNVKIVMTLTAPNCPVAESLPVEVEETVKALEGVNEVDVVLTFEPSWDQDMMSEEAKLDLGLL